MLQIEDDEFLQADDLTDVNDGEAVEEDDYGPVSSVREFVDPPAVEPPPDEENQNEEPS